VWRIPVASNKDGSLLGIITLDLNPARQKRAKIIFGHYICQLLDKSHRFNLHYFAESKTRLLLPPFAALRDWRFLPNLLCCSGLEAPKYVFAHRASILGQTRQLQDLG